MKKFLLFIFFSLFSFSAIHAEKDGDIEWNLSDDGTLTISGKGDMPDNSSLDAPWYKYNQKIKTVVIENGVTSIGMGAFFYCSGLTSVTIPNSVTSIGNSAFYGCKSLTSVTIPNSVTSIGENAFWGCKSLTSVTIPNSVTSIDNYAFKGCSSLTSITIPNSVTSIGGYAFYGCSSLTSIAIPSSVSSIGDYAFVNCSGLTSITFKGNTPQKDLYQVFGPVYHISVYVPANSIEAYNIALGGGLVNIQAIPPLSLTDNDSYVEDSQIEGVDISYTRNFTNTKWQAIYLPFSLKYEDLKDDFELAYINTVRQYDKDNDGVIDKTEMEIIKMKSGSTVPNMPYLIRAKKTGEKTFSAENATVYAAEENSVDCSTTIAKFTITGTYKPIPYETLIANKYYAMGGGELVMSNGSDLKPFRWYMKVEARDYSKYKVSNAAKAITIKVLDDEETTGIDELQIANSNSSVYDINGRMVNENNLKPGMYIKNGRKVIIK